MKLFFLFLISFYSLYNICITIVDDNTDEVLVGVKDLNSGTYSDLNGKIYIQKNSTVRLHLISYDDTLVSSLNDDKIIKLSNHN
jgi:hypothetical protein